MLDLPNRKKEAPRPDYLKHAPDALQIIIRDNEGDVILNENATLRQFSTKSWGYMLAGKMPAPNAAGRSLQVNVQLTVIGSKPGSNKAPN